MSTNVPSNLTQAFCSPSQGTNPSSAEQAAMQQVGQVLQLLTQGLGLVMQELQMVLQLSAFQTPGLAQPQGLGGIGGSTAGSSPISNFLSPPPGLQFGQSPYSVAGPATPNIGGSASGQLGNPYNPYLNNMQYAFNRTPTQSGQSSSNPLGGLLSGLLKNVLGQNGSSGSSGSANGTPDIQGDPLPGTDTSGTQYDPSVTDPAAVDPAPVDSAPVDAAPADPSFDPSSTFADAGSSMDFSSDA